MKEKNMIKKLMEIFLSLLITIFIIFSFPPTSSAATSQMATFSATPSLADNKEKPQLSPKYSEWLKLVTYIITPQEKEVFLKLQNDQERDIFIEAFWKQRDPTPETPQNEFKEEHIKRFSYANEHFRRGSGREGWMTDMGRIYIILGPPNSIERFDLQKGIQPCQVWYYYGETQKGLPPQFAVIFYQRGGAGEYKLYNPASDGPESLLVDTSDLSPTEYTALYERIKQLAPTLANVSFTLIPGQPPYNYTPSPSASILLNNIVESPKKLVNPTYATHFLNYKGIVSVEYATNFVDCDYDISLIRDPELDLQFLHFALNPKSVSVDYYEPRNQYYLSYQLTVSLKKQEQIIFQYTKDFPLYFSAEEIRKIKASGLSIQDSFPVLSGDYILSILMQNPVAKEFSHVEKAIHVPENTEGSISSYALGYDLKKEEEAGLHLPYKIGNQRLFIDPRNTFSPEDQLVLFLALDQVPEPLRNTGLIEMTIQNLENNQTVKQFSSFLREFTNQQQINLMKSVPAADLSSGYYRAIYSLKDKEKVLDSKQIDFSLSNLASSHPNIFSKKIDPANNFLFFYMVANQADKANLPEKAELYFKKVLELKPDFRQGLVNYLHFLLKMKRFEEALVQVEKIKDDQERRFDYSLIKGLALTNTGKFSEALDNLLEGNKINNSDTRLLNSIGYCYYRLGNKDEALRALRASLRLNPDQKEVADLIKKIEGGEKEKNY
ncbi:MAG: GWxTD domain-containing protein [Candidatus Saccharicenans sp.]